MIYFPAQQLVRIDAYFLDSGLRVDQEKRLRTEGTKRKRKI